MNILILSPSLATHGGIRILVDLANMLKEKGHHVVFHAIEKGNEQWAGLQTYYTSGTDLYLHGYDAIIAGSPYLAYAIKDFPAKKFLFLQMAEEMFKPDDMTWFTTCMASYFSEIPIITYSNWLIYRLRAMGVNTEIHYIDSGVSDIFVDKNKERDYILVANWNAQNPVKDVDRLGPRVAKFLKKKYNAKIVAYGADQPSDYVDVVDLYITNATTHDLVDLYNNAKFTLQATRFDCRSLVGQESISCGTPVCRAVISGDEDVKHLVNSTKCNYVYDELLFWADKMYSDESFYTRLKSNCAPVRWDADVIEQIISLT